MIEFNLLSFLGLIFTTIILVAWMTIVKER